jgi:hypothetical protein
MSHYSEQRDSQRKPRIKMMNKRYYCINGSTFVGVGLTPSEAYLDWVMLNTAIIPHD